ncbi:MAG: NADH:ubiquinone oxidoreductase subunit NDUFA12 [Rhodospirillales bacterium]|nr:NADH:ubiquinone oxidoreductase subunit NDUFA12 [Rhodospirillales bacterium]
MILGTRFMTWLKGELVGTDEFGNRYYRSKGKRLQGRERRWVIYRGRAEASTVPPEWHVWLHHTTDRPLTEEAAQAKAWQKAHAPNMTGTDDAYRPSGHDYKGGKRAQATGDYEAWTPDS